MNDGLSLLSCVHPLTIPVIGNKHKLFRRRLKSHIKGYFYKYQQQKNLLTGNPVFSKECLELIRNYWDLSINQLSPIIKDTKESIFT